MSIVQCKIIKRVGKKEWRVKSPSAVTIESSKGKEKTDGDSLILGTETFTIQQPIMHVNLTELILAIAPKHSANDLEGNTSQVKMRDPKYTQPKWCPPGLTKTPKEEITEVKESRDDRTRSREAKG